MDRLDVYICGIQFVLRGVNHHRYNATALSYFFDFLRQWNELFARGLQLLDRLLSIEAYEDFAATDSER